MLRGTWPKCPSLKIAFGGRFELGYDSYIFQRIKLGRCKKFHAGITICMIEPVL